MAKRKLTPQGARDVLNACKVNMHVDFDALHSRKVGDLLEWANFYGYRSPKNANGSRGRYWHAFLCRVAQRDDE